MSGASFRLEPDPAGEGITLRLTGDIDLTQKDVLTHALAQTSAAAHITVDLAETTYVDSTAINALVSLRRRLPAETRLRVICGPHTHRVFQAAGLADVLHVMDQAG